MTAETRPEAAIHVRPALFTDGEAINRVHQRNGLAGFNAAAWRNRWESYPFAAEFQGIPIGWVLETNTSEVVGTIANIHMIYEMGGRRLRVGIAGDWGVDEAHRGAALRLTTAFFKQKGLDILINGSASQTASRVLAGLRIPLIPIPDYASPCFWAASSRRFASAALHRKGVPAAFLLSYGAAIILSVRDWAIRPSKPSRPVQRAESFDERFDAICQRISAKATRLRAVRTREVLSWRFGKDLAAGRGFILTAETGYIVLLHRSVDSGLPMNLYDVADLQVEGDDPAIYRDLLLGAIQLARKNGVDAVKLTTGTPAKRAPAIALRPYTYQLPFWQLYFRSSPELQPTLATAEAWDFSLFETF